MKKKKLSWVNPFEREGLQNLSWEQLFVQNKHQKAKFNYEFLRDMNLIKIKYIRIKIKWFFTVGYG